MKKPKLDTRSWTNPVRMRLTIVNYAKLVLSLTAIHIFFTIQQKNWILLGINILFFLTAITTIISKNKFDKLSAHEKEE